MNLGAPSWVVEWLETISVWDLVLIAAAMAAGIVFIRKKGWRTVRALARGVLYADRILVAVQGLPEWQERIEHKVDSIHHETHNNDGSSIKDAVDRVEATSARLEEGVSGLHGRMDEVERNVAALARADEEIRAEIEHTQPPKES